jgi:AcrR family transcriptional regulator
MPTGTALHDAREQLFAAAERVLLRDGPNGLTSRAVTTEAGVAKGVLHRHFADFDSFLAELVGARIAALRTRSAALLAAAGRGTVAGNLTDALTALFDPIAVSIVGLVVSRHALLDRLRAGTPTGIPLLTEASAMLATYLAAERDLGRIAAGADVATLAPTLIGAAHMLFAGREHDPPRLDEVTRVVDTVIAGSRVS